MTDKFHRLAQCVIRDTPVTPDVYDMIVLAATMGYNKRAIEELEGETDD